MLEICARSVCWSGSRQKKHQISVQERFFILFILRGWLEHLINIPLVYLLTYVITKGKNLG